MLVLVADCCLLLGVCCCLFVRVVDCLLFVCCLCVVWCALALRLLVGVPCLLLVSKIRC